MSGLIFTRRKKSRKEQFEMFKCADTQPILYIIFVKKKRFQRISFIRRPHVRRHSLMSRQRRKNLRTSYFFLKIWRGKKKHLKSLMSLKWLITLETFLSKEKYSSVTVP